MVPRFRQMHQDLFHEAITPEYTAQIVQAAYELPK